MRPRERRETGEQDLFRSRLDRINDPTSMALLPPRRRWLSCCKVTVYGIVGRPRGRLFHVASLQHDYRDISRCLACSR